MKDSMMEMSIREAKARFSEAIAAAERGESIAITRHGRAVAKIGPPPPPRRKVASTSRPQNAC